MHTASLELCRELYELSRWETGKSWDLRVPAAGHEPDRYTPKYDLGYLLRKLPEPMSLRKRFGEYEASTRKGNRVWPVGSGDTPENAACRLAIELFKQGVLHPQDKGSDT